MGRANGLDQLVDAALALQQEGERRVALVAVGDGSERPRLQARAAELGLENLLFLAPRPKEALPALLAAADCTLTLFAPDPVFQTTSPNKFFDGLACGRPVVVNVDGWLRRLVETDRAGLYVPAGDGPALAAALAALAAEPEAARAMGARARRLAEREFSRDEMAARLLEVLTATVAEAEAGGGSVPGAES